MGILFYFNRAASVLIIVINYSNYETADNRDGTGRDSGGVAEPNRTKKEKRRIKKEAQRDRERVL